MGMSLKESRQVGLVGKNPDSNVQKNGNELERSCCGLGLEAVGVKGDGGGDDENGMHAGCVLISN